MNRKRKIGKENEKNSEPFNTFARAELEGAGFVLVPSAVGINDAEPPIVYDVRGEGWGILPKEMIYIYAAESDRGVLMVGSAVEFMDRLRDYYANLPEHSPGTESKEH
jgi:hypothetical protein